MLIKGTKISLLKQRDKLTGGEFIPFQEKWSNGKLNMKAIINHFSDVTELNISLQSLVNIKQFISSESELDSMTSNPGDIYYNELDKKLYMYSYNEDTQEGSYESSEPTSNQLYVMLTPLDEEKSNAVYRWDKNTKQFVAPSYVDDVVDVYAVYTTSPIGELSNIHLYSDKDRTTPILGETGKLYINKNAGEPEHLFRWTGTEYSLITDGGPLVIGEIENTAYDGAKGKHNADVLNSLPDTIIYAVQDYTNDASQVKLNYSFKRKKEDGTFANATNASKTLPAASNTEAGVMTAADKVKLDETLPNAIEEEKTNRELADATLDSKIDKEISDRVAAIDALSNTVDSNYTTLDNKITAETTRATNAESTLLSNLDAESQARQTADTQLSNKINSLELSTGQITDALQTALNQEITRATTAESTLQSNIDTINNSKGVANGIATLNEQGLVPASLLPSYVDDVVEVYATYDTSDTGQLSNIQLYTDAEHTNTVVAESGKIYVNVTADQPSYQFRWSGNEYIHITSGSLILGEITGTAYDGAEGAYNRRVINTLPYSLISTGIAVTQNKFLDKVLLAYGRMFKVDPNGGYSNVGTFYEDITQATSTHAGVMSSSDKVKLNALKTQSEITADIDAVQDNLTTHINNKTNPHEVTKALVGLGNVDNTSDLDKPISTAVLAALDAIPSNIPDEVVDQVDITRDDVMDTNTEKLFLYRHKTDIATGQGIGDYIEIPSASTTKDGLLTHTDKSKIDKISITGDGTKYLSDDGTYKTVKGGGNVALFPMELMAIDNPSTEQILYTFGGKLGLLDFRDKCLLSDSIILITNVIETSDSARISYLGVISMVQSTDDSNFMIGLAVYPDALHQYLIELKLTNDVATCTQLSADIKQPYYFEPLFTSDHRVTDTSFWSLKLAILDKRLIMVHYGTLSDLSDQGNFVPATATYVSGSNAYVMINYATEPNPDNIPYCAIKIYESNGTYTVDNLMLVVEGNVLSKDNTTEYTPTSNYNPATKKYVDDKAANAVTLDTSQTITGQKTFTLCVHLNTDTRGLAIYSDLRGNAGAIEILGENGLWTNSSLEFENSGDVICHKTFRSNALIKTGGTASQFLKADGSVDSNTYLRHTALNGGLIPSPETTWGNSTGTQVAEWADSTSNCAFKFKKDNPSPDKMSMLIDGTVYINEGQEAVASQSWVTDAYVKKSGDTITGELGVLSLRIENSNEINLNGTGGLYIGYRNTPEGINLCHQDTPLTYGSSGSTIWHAGNLNPSNFATTSLITSLLSTVSSLQSQINALLTALNDAVSRVSVIESQYVKSDNIRNITKKTSSEYASLTKDANTMYAVVD